MYSKEWCIHLWIIVTTLIVGYLAEKKFIPVKELKVNGKNFVLSSVYDVIKDNMRTDQLKGLTLPSYDFRNKRTTNEKVDYYNQAQGSESAEWVDDHQNHKEVVCNTQHKDDDFHSRLQISDNYFPVLNTIGSFLKYAFGGLFMILLPIIAFKVFVLPFKILLGLKAIATANTFLFGALLYRYLKMSGNGDGVLSLFGNRVKNLDIGVDPLKETIGNEDESDDVDYDNINDERVRKILQFIQDKDNKI